MKPHTAFMVLIERRIGRKLLSALLMLAQLIGLLHAPSAFAGLAYGKARKVASDLQSALDAPTTNAV